MWMDDWKGAEPAASATECTGALPALTDAAGETDCRRLVDVTAARRRARRSVSDEKRKACDGPEAHR